MKTTLKIIAWGVCLLAYSGWSYLIATNSPPHFSKFDAWVTAPAGMLLYVATVIMIGIAAVMLPFIIIGRWLR